MPTDFQLGPNNTSVYIPGKGWLVPYQDLGNGDESFQYPAGSDGVYRATASGQGTPYTYDGSQGLLPFFQGMAGGKPNPISGMLYADAPGSQYYKSAPDESFLSSFLQGPGFVGGAALGANALFGGGLGGFSSLFGGEGGGMSSIGDWFNKLFGGGNNALSSAADLVGGEGAGGGGIWDMGGNVLPDLVGGEGAGGGGIWDMGGNVLPDLVGGEGAGGGGIWDMGGNVLDSGSFNDIPTGSLLPDELRSLSELGPATNLQDKIVKMDQLMKAGSTAKQIADALGLSESTINTLGKLLSTGLGMYGANRQANAMQNLANQAAGYGAPYRTMLANSYADPSGFLKNSPDIQASVQQGTDSLSRALSTQGNPAQSGNALQQLQNYATTSLYGQLGNERQRLANFGGLSSWTGAAPQAQANAIQAQGGTLNALGAGINQITNPQRTLAQELADYKSLA